MEMSLEKCNCSNKIPAVKWIMVHELNQCDFHTNTQLPDAPRIMTNREMSGKIGDAAGIGNNRRILWLGWIFRREFLLLISMCNSFMSNIFFLSH